MSDKFDIDASLFLHVRAAAGEEETRYYLTGVLIEPIADGGAWIVATDGRVILAARDDTAKAPRKAVINLTMPKEPDPCQSGICDFDECALQKRTYDNTRMTFAADPGKASVVSFTDEGQSAPFLHAVCVDMDCADLYPKWRRVFGETKAMQPRQGHQGYGVDPDLLARVAGGRRVSLRSTGDGKAFQILFNGHASITGLIMPVDLKDIVASQSALSEIVAAATPADVSAA